MTDTATILDASTPPAPAPRVADRALRARAARVVPAGGMYGHQAVRFAGLPANYPQFFAGGEGAHVQDVDGNRYLDLMGSWGPVVLGHRHPVVEAAARAQAELGDCLDGPGERMVELAELLTATVADADWAMFAKNGNDATTMACTVARAATGRRTVLKAVHAYHGASPAFTPLLTGTTPADRAHLVQFTYNDLAAAEAAAAEHDGDVAAVIVTPHLHDGPGDQQLVDPGFARGLRALCDRIGAVLVLDEVRAGFRLDLRGSWADLGVSVDLSAFSKAMANGYAISALTGRDALREAAGSIFVTGSFWTSAVAMAASLATIRTLAETDGTGVMAARGTQLVQGLRARAASAGLQVSVSGPVQMPLLRFADDADLALARTFAAGALDRGVYLHPSHNWFVSAALTEAHVDTVLDAAEGAFADVRDALEHA